MNKKLFPKIAIGLLIVVVLIYALMFSGVITYITAFLMGFFIAPLLLVCSIILSSISLDKGKNKMALISLIISIVILLLFLYGLFFTS